MWIFCCAAAKLCLALCDPQRLQDARLLCPSPSPRVYSNSCPLSQGCHLTILSSAIPLSRLIHNHTRKETNQISFSWWMILKLAYPYNEILLDIIGTYNNIDEFQMKDAKLYRFTKATWYLITLYDILKTAKFQGKRLYQRLPELGGWGKD